MVAAERKSPAIFFSRFLVKFLGILFILRLMDQFNQCSLVFIPFSLLACSGAPGLYLSFYFCVPGYRKRKVLFVRLSYFGAASFVVG